MRRPEPWIVDARLRVADCKVFFVDRIEALSPADRTVHPFYVIQSSDWVNVIPLTDDGQVVMVRQWRHGSQEFSLEIPGGLVEAHHTPLDSGRMELFEETGHQAETWRQLGHINPNPALFTNRVYTFVAENLTEVARPLITDTEHTEVVRVALADVPELITTGTIDHSLVISAFALFFLGPDGTRLARRDDDAP